MGAIQSMTFKINIHEQRTCNITIEKRVDFTHRHNYVADGMCVCVCARCEAIALI